MAARLKVTQIKSKVSEKQNQRDTLRSLGLKRINHAVELTDTPAVRGMVEKISYLVRVDAT